MTYGKGLLSHYFQNFCSPLVQDSHGLMMLKYSKEISTPFTCKNEGFFHDTIHAIPRQFLINSSFLAPVLGF